MGESGIRKQESGNTRLKIEKFEKELKNKMNAKLRSIVCCTIGKTLSRGIDKVMAGQMRKIAIIIS